MDALSSVAHLTYDSLNEITHRLADPLRHLGIDLALHQTWPGRSSPTHIRRHPFRPRLFNSRRHDPRAWCSLAAHTARLATDRHRWLPPIHFELRTRVLGRAAHLVRSGRSSAINLSCLWINHRARLLTL